MVGIIGTRTVEMRADGSIVEVRTGSQAHKHIGSLYIIVEDELAKKVVDSIACECENLPRKYIFSGVHSNQAACLFGFMLYAKFLEGTNVPTLSIVAIDDGDVSIDQKNKRLNKLLKGNFLNPDLVGVREKVSSSLLSFNLEYALESERGTPEYNHKKWFEEITIDMYLSKTKPSNPYEQNLMDSFFEVQEFSKSIDIQDYHHYYKELLCFSPSITLDKFHSHHVEFFVLDAIRKYNSVKWEFYTGHIKAALLSLHRENIKNFSGADMFFRQSDIPL